MNAGNVAKIFKALSNANRLELFLKIMESRESEFDAGCGCFLSDIISSFTIGAPTVSHHIKELANAGLIETERKGKFLACRVNNETLAAVHAALGFGRACRDAAPGRAGASSGGAQKSDGSA